MKNKIQKTDDTKKCADAEASSACIVSPLTKIFRGRAQKYNHYQESSMSSSNHSCSNCMRRLFSYPYTCNDGWPCGDSNWVDRGINCLNWTDDKKAEVD